MSLGPAVAGGGGAKRASAPTHRPTWLLILSSITLMYGGTTLGSALTALRNPTSIASYHGTRPLGPEDESLAQQIAAVATATAGRHAKAIRARAVLSILVALVMLYSAAAALARDKNGRRANLIAAWIAIGYQLGALPLELPFARDYAAATAPLWTRLVVSKTPALATADAGPSPGAATATAPDPAQIAAMTSATETLLFSAPIVLSLLGIGGSAVILAYFGGRRGRALYGLPPRG